MYSSLWASSRRFSAGQRVHDRRRFLYALIPVMFFPNKTLYIDTHLEPVIAKTACGRPAEGSFCFKNSARRTGPFRQVAKTEEWIRSTNFWRILAQARFGLCGLKLTLTVTVKAKVTVCWAGLDMTGHWERLGAIESAQDGRRQFYISWDWDGKKRILSWNWQTEVQQTEDKINDSEKKCVRTERWLNQNCRVRTNFF